MNSLANLEGKGGGVGSGTVLWENPIKQASSTNFGAQTVSVSQDISRFKTIGIKYRMNRDSLWETMAETYLNADDFRISGQVLKGIMIMGVKTETGALWGRNAEYRGGTSVYFNDCARIGAYELNDSIAIPWQIIGY